MVFIGVLLALFFCATPSSAVDDPIYIGVLLPLSGTEGLPLYDALRLAVSDINDGGGISGRPVKLVLRDTQTGDINTYAKELAEDPRIRVVIGPYTSDNLFQISDLFISNQKVLISPTASSDEIFRAFAGTGSVWRIVSNDGDMTSVLIQHLKKNNAEKVAILAINSSYGKTFSDWIPYWALESGISITGFEDFSRQDQISEAIDRVCSTNPDYLVFVHSGSSSEITTAVHILENYTSTNLYLIHPNVDEHGSIQERADSKTLHQFMNAGVWKLGNSSIKVTKLPENTLMLMAKPGDQNFYQEFKKFTKDSPSDYVCETYDAVLCAALVMAQFTANPTKSPKHAAMVVLANGSGEPLPRSVTGFQSAFDLIKNGKSPILTGATGPLTFASDGTDRLIPSYETYHIEGDTILSDPVSLNKLTKSDDQLSDIDNSSSSSVFSKDPESGDYWAVIGAFSKDWVNYRHQADALSVYQFVKKQGVSDDHIILLVIDDIPYEKRNKKPNEVFHLPGKEEVRTTAHPDYTGDQVNKQILIDILTGMPTTSDKPVLQSTTNSTVLVYLTSHADSGGNILFGNGDDTISPKEFSSVIDTMADNDRFGKMLIILESCYSSATAALVKTPDVVVISASAPNETSKASIYDSELSSWLSNEFTSELLSILRESDPSLSLRHLYQNIYYHVRSSHPGIIKDDRLLNTQADLFFGG
nr:C13 family peptidase [uncultured Methanospirillum sp.]